MAKNVILRKPILNKDEFIRLDDANVLFMMMRKQKYVEFYPKTPRIKLFAKFSD